MQLLGAAIPQQKGMETKKAVLLLNTAFCLIIESAIN
jgi:hypothetical protein